MPSEFGYLTDEVYSVIIASTYLVNFARNFLGHRIENSHKFVYPFIVQSKR
jgi:hypothetical protein